MSTFSYAPTYGNSRGYNASSQAPATPTVRMASPAQINTYRDMVAKRRLRNVVEIEKLTYQEAYDLIGNIRRNNITGASDKQIETIKDMIGRLQSAGVRINTMSDDDLNGLTGGTTGSAYSCIQNLMQMLKDNNVDPRDKPSVNVVRYIVEMFTYPEVDWEAFGVPTRIYLDEWFEHKSIRKQMHRIPTPDEFGTYIMEHKSAKECADFLEKYRAGFNEYKSTLIRPEQERRIRQLEGMLARNNKPRVQQWAVDEEGNYVQLQQPIKQDYDPTAYVSLYDDIQIRMITIEQASQHITQLEMELNRRYPSPTPQDATFEELRTAKTTYEASIQELKAVTNFLFALQAHTGFKTDEVDVVPFHDEHDRHQGSGVDVFFDKNNITSKRKHKKIRAYLSYVLEKDLVTLRTMMLMARESTFITEMIDEMVQSKFGIRPIK